MKETVTQLNFGDKTYLLVGTAHVSQESIEEVEQVIREEKPDRVCVEIDEGRYRALSDPQSWEKLNIFKVIRERKGFLLLANLTLASFQKKIGQEVEVKPGSEMLQAIKVADELEIPNSYIDREIQVTLKRAWKKSSLIGKSKLMSLLLGSVFEKEEKIDKAKIESLKEKNELDHMMEDLARELPTIKEVLIDERNQYLATKLFESSEKKIVAVVGAGHVPGMIQCLESLHQGKAVCDMAEISKVPAASVWSRVWPFLVPAIFLSFFVAGFIMKGPSGFWQMLLTLALSTGGAAALGSLLALAHPVTILVAFVMAPITSLLHPFLHIGYFTGLSEAYFRKPRVGDLQTLGEDSGSLKGFYKNRILRILLVLLLSTIGATIAYYISLAPIAGAVFNGK